MKTNIDYIGKKYFVNKRNNTVCCILNFKISLRKLPIMNLLFFTNWFHNWLVNYVGEDNIDEGDFSITFSTIGLAKCAPGDKFNESLGKKIALTRAQQEAFMQSKEFYTMMYKCIHNISLDYLTLASNSDIANKDCKNHVIELINK